MLVYIQKIYDSQEFTAKEIIDEVHLITMDKDTKWQIEGKNIDDA